MTPIIVRALLISAINYVAETLVFYLDVRRFSKYMPATYLLAYMHPIDIAYCSRHI